MKNKIVTCSSNTHPIYIDRFKENGIKIGKSYRCIEELTLTADNYYKPEFASLKGITICNGAYRWGWKMHCYPKECFREATLGEIRKYKLLLLVKHPLNLAIIYWFKMVDKIDRFIRKDYYAKLEKEAEDCLW